MKKCCASSCSCFPFLCERAAGDSYALKRNSAWSICKILAAAMGGKGAMRKGVGGSWRKLWVWVPDDPVEDPSDGSEQEVGNNPLWASGSYHHPSL